ncbi:GNAT family N-acetyltransferase [Sinorhizobium meliloti]|uniref:GNAT family N-acetyltransferase n=1 Tax=Rhizobium meliloti TaxID=382 RepID=UPI000416436E|nr:GNAT family N-acetyltransferase [Sinorhizobium meliloti]MDE3830149.1 GNAT family N-acetyltransferase [Sinorhizobium meliloti]MDE4578238.1 GNAT family N-acetyltransferase [Sinorhizobium meliloti]MDW9781978.1 GNAT family N-acetyltransferase [Sinorhizobium meliloti]RVK73997.1 GNAT family N-acetyltransferase [Sinorhizobium meliloti]RVL10683.1 GNAT family N-acetyltransferase [Sinorhizobium meliloti]
MIGNVLPADVNGSANRLLGGLAQSGPDTLQSDRTLMVGRPGRHLAVYPARAGYDLQRELDFLSNRAIEQNVFFTGRFLAPAMPRLEDRVIRLAVIRDQSEQRSRLRFLMPFSIEKPGFSIGATIIRAWSNPFGPLGTPLLDAEDAAETISNLYEALAAPSAGLPPVLVLPDIRLNGKFAQLARAVAIGENLPLTVTDTFSRPMLESLLDGPTYLREAVSSQHLRELKRQWNNLAKQGALVYNVARQPDEIRLRMEEFLVLEASGWKGRERSAMIMDRFRAAFAREAVNNLAEADSVRIHTLDLDGKAIATVIVLLMAGEAFAWKTAYDERYAKYSPGKLLVAELTEWHLDDANIIRSDSCAVPDHPVMSRLWQEREEMGTLVIGLAQNRDRDVRQVAAQLHLYRNTRNMARLLREKIRALAGR